MQTKHAELKAGVVVLLAIGVLLALLWLASGSEWPWTPHRHIFIRFEQGFAAPIVGDPVLMNGVEIGNVKAIEQREERREGATLTRQDAERMGIDWMDDAAKARTKVREIYVMAEAQLPVGQKIPRDTVAEISVSVTGQRELRLKPGLSPEDLSDEDTKTHPILATAAGDIADIARDVQALVSKVSGLIDAAKDTVHDVREVVRSVKQKIDVFDFREVQRNVTDASVSLRGMLATAQTRVDEITIRLSDAIGSLKGITGEASLVVQSVGRDAQAALADLKATAAEIRAIVERIGPKVDAAIDDIARAARSVASLGRELEGIGPHVHEILGRAGDGIEGVIEKLNETGHNLADASEDLRAHPWKLLNKPDASEIAYENLRNATSNYVRASQAVEAAARALKDAEARTNVPDDEKRRLVEEALTRLKADLARYDDAARRFAELLQQGGGPPARIK
jgi:ABC-type transporter Mla subunit MlaD